MLLLFIYVTSISFGHLQMIKYQDIIPINNKNQQNIEQLSSPSQDNQKNTEFQIFDIQQNIATTKSIDNLKNVFSTNGKKNCLTDKTVFEEPHNKDIQNEIKNENVFKNQENEVQLKIPIARYNFDSPNTYSNFQLNSYIGEDMKRSGQTVKDDSYVGTKFDDIKSTRRFAHNIFNQNISSDELKTIMDHNLRPDKSQTKSDKFDDQPKDLNIIIEPDGKDIQMNNYNEISYDDDDDGEYISSSRELEKLNNYIANQLKDPTKGLGISEMKKSHMMIMKHPRVCYACSSINDLSCWTPNRLTSVKYCHEDHTSCLTKIFKDKDVRYITRDCGSACVPSARLEFKLKYDFCTICHTDLCNNGLSTHIEVIIIIIFVLIHFIFLF